MNDDIVKSLEVLRNGGVILYPTDTIWGIGCDATNENAVRRVFDIKKRVDSKSLLLLVDSVVKLEAYVNEVPDLAYDLIELSEKPVSIIYSEARNLASGVIADDGSVGIRVTSEAFSKSLCERFRKPIVSTSANISGEPSPTLFREISPSIINAVDYVVKFRQDDMSIAQSSSIIKLQKGGLFTIIRE